MIPTTTSSIVDTTTTNKTEDDALLDTNTTVDTISSTNSTTLQSASSMPMNSVTVMLPQVYLYSRVFVYVGIAIMGFLLAIVIIFVAIVMVTITLIRRKKQRRIKSSPAKDTNDENDYCYAGTGDFVMNSNVSYNTSQNTISSLHHYEYMDHTPSNPSTVGDNIYDTIDRHFVRCNGH